MTPAMIQFLKCFEDRCPVFSASDQLFSTDKETVYRHPSIPPLAYEAAKAGWLVDWLNVDPVPAPDDLTKVGKVAKVFFMDLELTAAGREVCGLPPRVVVVAAPKKSKKPEKAKVPSLFGDDDLFS